MGLSTKNGVTHYRHLADPKYWPAVLRDFPTLTLNVAHNDRTGSSWQPKISELIKPYPNVYTDISYDTEMWFMPRRYFKGIKGSFTALIGTWDDFFGPKSLTSSGFWNTRLRLPGAGWNLQPRK